MSDEIFLYNRVRNKNACYNIWFAFPERYSFSLASLGYLWIFKEIDEIDDIFIERICTDTENTRLKAQDVDAVCFSFSFDMDFINIFGILEKYGYPLKAEDRESYPLIFAGGPVLTSNPEPYKEFFDFMIIGDGEGINKKVVQICKENKTKPKREVLKMLAQIKGVYVPSIHNLRNRVTKGLSELSECIYTPILSNDSFFKNTFIIEISRGCYNCCGFCLASYLNLPVRFVDYNTIIEKIDFGLQYTNKIALLGALVSAHPKFHDICAYIQKKIQSGQKIELSISSLRVDTITPDIAKTLYDCGQKNITIAIEAASERLRKIINKNITESQLFSAIKAVQENGISGVKIYAMLGLPKELREDIDEFIRLAKDLKKEFKRFNITFSFSTFVPKPHTPFQWCAREDTKTLEHKIEYLKKELFKAGIRPKFSSVKQDYYQTLLSRGDNSITDYLIEVYKSGGKFGAYRAAAKKFNIDTDKYVLKAIDIEKELPWNVIEMNPGEQLLKNEYIRLMSK